METYKYEIHNQDVSSNYLSPSWVQTLSPTQEQTKIEEISLPASINYPKRYIMLGCFVVGEDKAFIIETDKIKTISQLRDTIKAYKENMFKTFDANQLTLWKVDIPETEKQKINANTNIVQKFGAVELKKDFDTIEEHFGTNPTEKHIHILVKSPPSPATTVPFAKTISLAQIEREVQYLFKIHSQDLEKVATNKYDPYMYFKAPDEHPYKSEIDEKKIPMLGGNPNLLLYNLPGQNEEFLTSHGDFLFIERIATPNNMTIIMGTSGCGKTRLCLELLCRDYGLYFVTESWNLGSDDLELATEWTKDEINIKPELKPDDAKKLAERALWSCITARLYLLNDLFCMAEERNSTMEPKSWLTFQLNHRLITELSIIFRNCDATHLREYCLSIMEDINNKLKGNIFPIIYDEAQSHTSCLADKFPSYNNNKIMRPFFTVAVKTMTTLRMKCVKAVVFITGSGLSLLEAKDLASSNVAKEGSLIPTFNQFGQIKTSEEILKLVNSIFPLKEEYASMAIRWLKGRYRFTWTWIHYLLKSYNPKEQLEELIRRLTTDVTDQRNPKYSLYSGLVRLIHHPNERHSYIDYGSVLDLIKRAVIYYAMTGRRFLYKNTREIDIMSIGFAHLEAQELTGIIDEPLAIQAGINYFKEAEINNMWFNVMSQVNFDASMPGSIWEKCVANFLHNIVFKSNTPLSSHEKLFPDRAYLPVNFGSPPKLLPSGKNRVGMISVELSAPEEYIEWLNIVSLWEKKGKVSDGFCPICYPPNTAGPDISIAFFFPEGGKREAYILNVQVKLRNKVELKKACKTVDPETMFTDKDLKPNPFQPHEELRKIYKKRNWDNRNIRMIVAYPCNFKRKRDYQKTPGASKRIRKIPRLIIDENNADSLIPNDCQNWVKCLKQEQGSKVDWECSDIENSEDEE